MYEKEGNVGYRNIFKSSSCTNGYTDWFQEGWRLVYVLHSSNVKALLSFYTLTVLANIKKISSSSHHTFILDTVI